MIANNSFRIVFAMIVLSIFVGMAQGNCPDGLRRTNIERYNSIYRGKANDNPMSIVWTGGYGAIWLNRKVLVHPRFKLGFTVEIRGVPWYSLDNPVNVDGFTSIISKHALGYLQEDYYWNMGYEGITDSVVTEFDLYRNNILKRDAGNGNATLSYHKCRNSRCSADEAGTEQTQLPYSYNARDGLRWSIEQFYDAKHQTLKTFINGAYIAQTSVNTENDFDGTAYIGFTGSLFSTFHRDYRFFNAYVCEDDYSHFNLRFAANGASEINLLANAGTRVDITPYTSQGYIISVDSALVPNYNLRAAASCGQVSSVQVLNNAAFYFNVAGCTIAGKHIIALYSGKGENGQKLNFSISASGFEKLELIHNLTNVGGNNWIKEGKLNGDYIQSDYHGFIPFRVNTYDRFNNSMNLGSDPVAVCSALGAYTSLPSGRNEAVRCEGGNGSYTIHVPIPEIGTQTINFKHPSLKTFYIGILSGAPVVSRSILRLTNASSSPTVRIGDTISSECRLVDSQGKAVAGTDVVKYHQGNLLCEVIRTSLSGTSTTFPGVVQEWSEGFKCTYVVQHIGPHRIEGKLKVGNQGYEVVPTGINSFTSVFTPSNIKNVKYFNPSDNVFVGDNSNWSNNFIHYSTTSSWITLIDFISTEGDSIGRDNGKYYDSAFDHNKIKAKVWATEKPSYETGATVSVMSHNGGRYYSIACDSSYFKKTTQGYNLNLEFNGNVITLKIKTPQPNTRGERVCLGDLYPDYTLFMPEQDLPELTMNCGQDIRVGAITTKTENDCLYPYWIDTAQFSSNTQGVYFTKQEVEGFYDLKFTQTKAGQYYIESTLGSKEFVGGYLVTVKPKDIICAINPEVKFNKFENEAKKTLPATSNDNVTTFKFIGKDDSGSILDKNPAQFNKYMGLKLTVNINGIDHPSKFENSKTSNISYDRRERVYIFYDYYTIPGNYEVTITGGCGLVYKFNYLKTPGVVDINKSTSTITSNSEIVFAKKASVSLNLRDKQNYSVTSDAGHVANELKKVVVEAISNDNATTVAFKFVKIEGESAIYESDEVKRATSFQLSTKYEGRVFACSGRCGFTVRFGDIFIANTRSNIILSKTTPILSTTTQQVDNNKDVPVFSSEFYDDGNNFIEIVKTTEEKFKGTITGRNFEIELSQEWVNNNKLVWTIKKDDQEKFKNAVSTSPYTFNIHYKDLTHVAVAYPLKFLGDGSDEDAGNGEMDIANTIVDKTSLESIAGETTNFKVILMTKEKLRVNKYDNVSMFSVANKLNDSGYVFDVQNGPKKGTYIFTVSTTKSTSPDLNEVQVAINKINIPALIKHKVFCSTLSILKFAAESIKDQKDHVLLDSRATEVSNFDFLAFDKYGNSYEPIFDENAFPPAKIANLFTYEHTVGENVTVTAVCDKKKGLVTLNVRCKKVGIVLIKSRYMLNQYKSNVFPGPISTEKSYTRVANNAIVAGEKINALIHHLDKYENVIPTDQANEEIKNFFTVALHSRPTESQIQFKEVKPEADKSIIVQSEPIKLAGSSLVKSEFRGEILKCINCSVQVSLGPIDFKKSKVARIAGSEISGLVENRVHNTISGEYPLWRLNLFDTFLNKYDKIPAGVSFKAEFSGPKIDVLLCSEIVDDHVDFQVCPDEKARNVWKYLLSRDDYVLTVTKVSTAVTELPENLVYKMSITGGEEDKNASNGATDITKTWFSKDKILVKAGQTEEVIVEVRTAEGKRRNFWYLQDSAVSIAFSQDAGAKHYKVEIEKYTKPGQYRIRLSSTKTYPEATNNRITVTIDGEVCTNNNPHLIVTHETPVRGELFDDQQKLITALPDGNADMLYKFNVRLFDIHNNLSTMGKDEDLPYRFVSPTGEKKTSNCNLNSDGYTFKIELKPTLAGVWKFESSLISKDALNFNNYPGAVSPNTSILKVPSKTVAGQEFQLRVQFYDQYNNLIDPDTMPANPVETSKKPITKDNKSLKFEKIENRPRLSTMVPQLPVRNFNKKIDRNRFIVGIKKQKVFFKDSDSKCLEVTKGKLEVSKDTKCTQKFEVNICSEDWYQVKVNDKNCLQTSDKTTESVACDCNNANQNFRLNRNFDLTFYIVDRLGLAWNRNLAGEIASFRLKGGKEQEFYLENAEDKVKSAFEGEQPKDGEIPCLEYLLREDSASDFIFSATIQGIEIRMDNNVLTVEPGAPNFPSFGVNRATNTGAEPFAECPASFSVNNTKENVIFQIIGKDRFGNLVPKVEKTKYNASIIDTKNTKNEYKLVQRTTQNEGLVEFVVSDETNSNKFPNLVKGEYVLRFTDGADKIERTCHMLGDEKDTDANNDPLDIQQTEIREGKFALIAGETGEMMIKLKTKSGLRRNEWNHKVELTDNFPNMPDGTKSFTYKVDNGGKRGIYIIRFKSLRTNTFPVPAKVNSFQISINGELVKNITQKVEISPAPMHKCKIDLANLQSANEIRSGTADKELTFGVTCVDEHDNECKVISGDLEVKVAGTDKIALQGIRINVSQAEGRATYTVPTTIAQVYKIEAAQKFLPGVFSYDNKPGLLVADNTLATVNMNEIPAGQNAILTVICRDRYKNQIDADLIKDRVKALLKDSASVLVDAVESINGNVITETVLVKRKGRSTFIIEIDGSILSREDVNFLAIPGPADLNLSGYLSNSLTPVEKNVVTFTNLYLTQLKGIFRDAFNNDIDVLPAHYKIENCVFSGNSALPITFTPTLSPAKDVYQLDITDFASIQRWSRLVGGIDYRLSCQWSTDTNKKTIDLGVNIRSCRPAEDKERGNGHFVPANTDFSPEKLAMTAGETSSFQITLRTAEKLIYNDRVAQDTVFKWSLKQKDDKFNARVYRSSMAKGVFTFEFSTTTSFGDNQVITFEIQDPATEKYVKLEEKAFEVVILPKLPPVSRLTTFTQTPKDIVPAGKPIVFEYKLYDEFGNHIRNNEALCGGITLFSNDIQVQNSDTKLSEDKNSFITTATIAFPPRSASVQLFYFTGKSKSEISPKAIEIFQESSPDFTKSAVSGKNFESLTAGESMALSVQLRDNTNVCVDTKVKYNVVVETYGQDVHNVAENKKCILSRNENPKSKDCVVSYDIEDCGDNVIRTKAGTYNGKVFVDNILVKEFKQTVIAGPIDVTKFTLKDGAEFNALKLTAGKVFEQILQAHDSYGNPIETNLEGRVTLSVNGKGDAALDAASYLITLKAGKPGQLNVSGAIYKVGEYYLAFKFDGKDVVPDYTNAASKVKVVPAEANGKHTQYETNTLSTVGQDISLTVQFFDKYNNKIDSGKLPVKAAVTYESKNVESSFLDNVDGTYTLKFNPKVEGSYAVEIKVKDENEERLYGNSPIRYTIRLPECKEDKPIRCPADGTVCVSDIKLCLDKTNTCPSDRPAQVKIGGKVWCELSQTEGDCQDGYLKCATTQACLPKSKFASWCPDAPDATKTVCGKDEYLCKNHMCVANGNQCPSPRRCPFGFHKCADHSCQKDISDCPALTECGSDEIRCLSDASCKKSYDKCASGITCPKSGEVVGPDNKCYASESQIRNPPTTCSKDKFICQDNLCVDSLSKCSTGKVCEKGTAFCSDGSKCAKICNKDQFVEIAETAEDIVKRSHPNKKLEEEEKKRLEQVAEAERLEKETKRIEEEKRKATEAKIEAEKIVKETEIKNLKAKDEEKRLQQIKEEAERKALEAKQAFEAEEAARRRAAIELNRGNMERGELSGITFYSAKGTHVKDGLTIKLLHLATKKALHSHPDKYPGGNQEITCYDLRNEDDWFQILGNTENGKEVRFRHSATDKYLFIDQNSNSPVTRQSELSGRSYNGDARFNFKIEIINSWFGDSNLRVGDVVRFRNSGTGYNIHSHSNMLETGSKQQEATGFNGNDTNDYWVIIEVK